LKRLLLLLALAVPAQAQQEAVFSLPLFTEGLHTRYSANAIPDGALSDALNVLLDEDVNGVVVSRNGYAKYNASAITNTKTVRGLWPFDASDGTKYLVALSSAAFYKTTGDGTWTAITGLSGYSSTKEFDCVQTLGAFYCGNGDTVFSWNGTSTATLTGAPIGNLLGRFRNRLLIAGIPGSKARLRGSGELDTSDWTVQVPGVSTTPFNIAFGGADDGEEITCLMGAYQDVFIVGKRQSLWGLYGFGRADFQVREISREVGCLEQRSVREKNNCLYWLSLRGIEKYCGSYIERVGDPIRDKIDTIVATAGNARTATDTTQSDFEAGNLTASGAGAPVSASIAPFSVVPASFSRIEDDSSDWSGGTFSSVAVVSGMLQISTGAPFFNAGVEESEAVGKANWITTSFSTASLGIGVKGSKGWCSGSTGVCTLSDPNSIVGRSGVPINFRAEVYERGGSLLFSSTTYNVHTTQDGTSNSDIYVNTSTMTANREIYAKFYVVDYPTFTIQTTTFTNWRNGFAYRVTGNCQIGGAGACNLFFDITGNEGSGGVAFASGTFTSRVFDTAFSTPIFSMFNSTFTAATIGSTVTLQMATSADGVSFGVFTSTMTSGLRYAKYRAIFNQENSTQVATLSGAGITAATTGYFISQCRNSTGVTEWGVLACNISQTGGGSITLAVSTGTSCFEATRPTNTWTSTSNNTLITVATATHIAYRALFDFNATTQALSNRLAVLDCSMSWTEGESRPPIASQVYRDRYYLSYTSSTASGAVNDHILVLDKNDKWTLFDNHRCYSLALYERKLYCGSSTDAGQVWRLDQGTDDDGASFTSQIRTKAFNFGMPERRKEYRRLYLDLEPAPSPTQTISLTGSYTLERSTPTYSLGTIDLNEDPGSILTPRIPFPIENPVSGRYIQLDLRSNSTNSPWRLFSGRLYFLPLDPE
jgi:hypothetical protein